MTATEATIAFLRCLADRLEARLPPPDPDVELIVHWNHILDERRFASNYERAAIGGELQFKTNVLRQRRPDLERPLKAVRRRILIECLGASPEAADRRLA